MLENSPVSNIFAISLVIVSIGTLIYFALRTLITSNLFQKGIKLFQAKDYEGAEAAFRQVIAINSTNDMVRLLLGDILNHKGEIDQAKELFSEVIILNPKNPNAYLRLANILLLQKNEAEAINNLKQAKDLFQKQRQPQKVETIEKILQDITGERE
ncbi:tetratricopeptide repeat protein [Anabaena cylindrica FACHB-243]|uniref:Tetratricopeptide TPR_1 repeat-containing protein n=1 Tax=Anabaena cylindrica (strain ATCC 27899 / PCC 7122) TaxID=272123 RepID=K9ZN28_ANACC|nr:MULTISPECIES: tetratricopeptide repeat protein [Anabaena]AFZ60616.1 Tetratricopeptide TPR_1 repeat-containing protein [Anabaena cylindrica PCC 7122]MBD2417036.1 tetratricopeptide repeat protein [Anabaena cylindrica FACHB-243]MBY5280365.1 tetratricopeptide repeat protein [Anabaena sp. CCAP 1446/1C]MBY5307600.1 tetratricopeptide repeat protein [Anabaena sp. CCAP 1446/1C]MCM2407195.1 tetratricopeptide repeat protein [Anabaena sp. CCAP 1446/1C]